jgi:hypothetical protein
MAIGTQFPGSAQFGASDKIAQELSLLAHTKNPAVSRIFCV